MPCPLQRVTLFYFDTKSGDVPSVQGPKSPQSPPLPENIWKFFFRTYEQCCLVTVLLKNVQLIGQRNVQMLKWALAHGHDEFESANCWPQVNTL